jgi:eukaryotic-like serine/threonine-protein kinase
MIPGNQAAAIAQLRNVSRTAEEIEDRLFSRISLSATASAAYNRPYVSPGTVKQHVGNLFWEACMTLIGKVLGNFEITSQLGKGGMGEVFQAKDRKLGRDVAIKVLPEEFARDADRVARFQREAKLLASLNHPSIAAIYGLEESDGTNFLVLELVEGQTLADRIKAGPIPVEESLKLALQIAEALEAAHEKGVIHRDLKPANIKVTPEGKVKVLDFGLAKAFAGEQADLNLSNSPTLSNAATQQGVILGTAAYMSPEQAKGKAVDKRADVWAFGCVLFEMLTGGSVFSADDVSQTLARILERQPDFSSLPPKLHPKIVEMLERCLEKDAKNRYSGIGDARVDIQKVLANPSGALVQPVTAVEPRTRLRTILPWAAAALVLGLIIAGVAVWKLKPTEPRQVMRFEYELPEGQQFSDLTYAALAVSPDGKQFVYSTTKGLYLRSVDELIAKFIPGTEENTKQPLFSPDCRWIGYHSVADKKWKKIVINGGTPVVLCDANDVLNASWGADDRILYAESGKGILRISANGGTPELLVKQTGLNLLNPQILPDGKTVLFGIYRDIRTFQIAVQSLKSDEPKVLIEGGNARYLSTGHLVYTVRNSLFAIPFDLSRLEIAGGPVPLIGDVYQFGNRTPQYAVSNSGTLVYIKGTAGTVASGQLTLVWVDRKGKEAPITAAPNDYSDIRISPDGTKVALTIATADNKKDIWIWDLVRETITRLTFNGASYRPLWTPDGKRIAFESDGSTGKTVVYWKAADGTGEDEKLSLEQPVQRPSSWSKDGKTLLLDEKTGIAGGKAFIGTLSMEGGHNQRPLLQENHNVLYPKISPDGRWMAYISNESGKVEVYVRPFPDVNKGKWQVSISGGYDPLWSQDGRELFYRKGDTVMAVAVQTETTFKPGKTETLFRGTYVANFGAWDFSQDGKRFLMIKPPASTGAAPTAAGPRKINIVLNWFEELKQRVPLK